MLLPVTMTFAATATILNLWLASRVVRGRMATKTMTGDGGHSALQARMRAQGNFVEYAPFALILSALVELAGGSPTLLWSATALFVLGRVLHPFGMDRPAPNIPRAAGMLLTWGTLAWLAGWTLGLAFG